MNSSFETFKKNKKVALPTLFISGAIILVLFVVLPQFNSISQVRQDIIVKQERNNSLRGSLNVLSQTTSEAVNESFTTVDQALPNNKNVIGIFTAFNNAAQDAGVVIEGFSFEVGGVYNKDKKQDVAELTTDVRGVPSLQVILHVIGSNHNDIAAYADRLQKILPLAEVKTLSILNNMGDLQVNFFYKTYDIQQLSSLEEIAPIDAQGQKTLEELKSWRN